MRSVVLISLNFVLCVLMITMIDCFEREEHEIEAINKEHYNSIQKLEKISQINSWLNEVIEIVEKKEKNSLEEYESLIEFFDKNRDAYNLLVSKYIYEDELATSFDLSYSISADDKEKLADFIAIENQDGFLQFRKLKMDGKNLSGETQVINPHKLYKEDKNAFKH